MIAHVHEALAQVRRLQELVLEKRFFRGYSGKARIASGVLVVLNAAVLSRGGVPAAPRAHLLGWGITLALGLVINYASLVWWFLFDPEVNRNPRMLKSAVDAMPALALGAVLSLALLLAGDYRLLFGTWLGLYGLAQTAYRQSLPAGLYRVGLYYLACGVVMLLSPRVSFLNPWPMALAFCAGELCAGGILLVSHLRDDREARDGR